MKSEKLFVSPFFFALLFAKRRVSMSWKAHNLPNYDLPAAIYIDAFLRWFACELTAIERARHEGCLSFLSFAEEVGMPCIV